MIWYLLYPLRGTTDPPRLSADHPVRRAFYLHGKRVAQYWLVAMALSVAIAMGFSYPTLSLSINPTAGIQLRPHHVWTTSKAFDGDPKQTDIEMRQIWIHGGYMRALEKETLQAALRIQAEVMGDEGMALLPVEKSQVREHSWGYHSPLLYWNNSAQALDQDQDIAETVRDNSRLYSSLNVALRPSSVFAGKEFDGWRLRAADAIVISMLSRVGDGTGAKWSERMKTLKEVACADCTIFPRDGQVTFDFAFVLSFTPLSLKENLALGAAYTGMAIYVLVALGRLKAFHSRFGICITVITQMMCSILASITVCGVFKINLSTIPQNAYPFVVLVIGLENMFRIINAIVAQNPARPTEVRIANALGDVGPGSVATACQNFLILLTLSRFVSPGVAAFCAFACIATLFDAFFLLTFFVAVLSVDIRRFELSDALARANHTKAKRRVSPSRQHQGSSWLTAMLGGTLPVSTRMAGTAVTTTFILALNYHFFERHEQGSGLRQVLGAFFRPSPDEDPRSFHKSQVNATVTPDEWFRLQDFGTAWEVMWMAKPGADGLAVRVFSPLTIVLPGADRSGSPAAAGDWLFALRSFIVGHFYPTLIATVFIVGFVLLLLNYLLYRDGSDVDDGSRKEDNLTVQSIVLPHKLDIVKLYGHEKGHFISIGLDRSIAVAVFDAVSKSYQVHNMSTSGQASIAWPVYAATVDECGDWAAILTADDRVLIYNRSKSTIAHILEYPESRPPVIFRFTRLLLKDETGVYFIVVTSGGQLRMYGLDTGLVLSVSLSETPIVGGAILELPGHVRRLVTVTEDARITSHSWNEGLWTRGASYTLPVDMSAGQLAGPVTVDAHPNLESGLLVVSTNRAVLFLDEQQFNAVGKLDLEEGQHLRGSVMIGPSTSCQVCGSVAFRSIGLSSETANNRTCRLVCLGAKKSGHKEDEDGENAKGICLRKTKKACVSFSEASRTEYTLEEAGTWFPLSSQSVLGLRKQPVTKTAPPQPHANARSVHSSHRRRIRNEAQSDDEAATVWEAYEFSVDGEVEMVELNPETDAGESQRLGSGTASTATPTPETAALYVNTAGPTVALDSQSVAVAFGNMVKVIRATRRGATVRHETRPLMKRQPSTSRRRLTNSKGL